MCGYAVTPWSKPAFNPGEVGSELASHQNTTNGQLIKNRL
jgi:hypothetical protein